MALGSANIITGKIGKSHEKTNENRIYQEALLPHKLGKRLFLNHRFRKKHFFLENLDFRFVSDTID